MASRGVSLVFAAGDDATRKTLVDSLVGVLGGGPQAKQAVKLSGAATVEKNEWTGLLVSGESVYTHAWDGEA